jgi:pimeloyl-ACP methyl ester carboxylesterase
MPASHFIRAVPFMLCMAVSLGAAQQELPPPPSPTALSFKVFLRGVPIGSEQIAVTRTSSGWTIASSGRLAPPLDVVTRRAELRYTADWKPVQASVDLTVRGQAQTIRTTVDGSTAKTDITAGGQSTTKTDTIDPDAILLPNPIFSAYEALAARLRTAAPGSTIPAYVLPQTSLTIRVGESSTERIQTPGGVVEAHRTHVTLAAPNAPLEIDVWREANGRLLRITIPAQNLDVVREDLASVAARQLTISRPNDEQVRIPANGFTLAGTLSKPAESATGRLPAVVLTGGSGPADRDEVVFGIPILGQLAGALADAGFIVLRYDKRGIGQSGGRAETASLADYSDDQRAAVKLLTDRKDVDSRRIAVVGHSEGGMVSLLSAAKDKRIAAVVLIATNGTSGAELVLAQQLHLLNRSDLSDADKQARIDLQKRINEAVMTGKGLETLPQEIRRQVDNAEFQSILLTDPAKIVPNVRQPLLIVQGQLDTQVEPSNADRLEALARGRKNAPQTEVAKVPGVNHLLVPATTGEVDEYSRLTDKQISPAVSSAIVTWLKKTLK